MMIDQWGGLVLADVELENIDIEKLPDTAQEIIEVIGLKSYLRLSWAYQGIDLYISDKLNCKHSVAVVIGCEAYTALWKIYKGTVIRVVKLDGVTRQVRYERIREMNKDGCKQEDMVRESGYTMRHVLRILKRQREERRAKVVAELKETATQVIEKNNEQT